MARFNNNMFQDGFEFEDFDRTGIMDPGIADVIEMRKEANEARDGANDQYTADVADFKNTQATEAEQGIASLPEAQDTNQFYNNNVFANTNANTKFPTGPNGEPLFIGSEDIDYTGTPGSPINTTYTEPNIPFVPVSTNPYTNVFPNVPGEPEPVYVPPVETVYVPPVETVNTGLPEAEDSVTYVPPVSNDTGETTPYVPPDEVIEYGDAFTGPATDRDGSIIEGDSLPDYPFVDPETGGDYVLVVGDPTNPGPGVVVRDPETGELPPGFVEGGGDGPAGTIPPEVYVPAPAPTPASAPLPRNPNINIYTGRQVRNPYRPFEQPSSPVDDYIRPMDPADFGSAPGMNQGGRVPMGNNNTLNSGLSRLPINLQNDTLTQVFQSGFRPRR